MNLLGLSVERSQTANLILSERRHPHTPLGFTFLQIILNKQRRTENLTRKFALKENQSLKTLGVSTVERSVRVEVDCVKERDMTLLPANN